MKAMRAGAVFCALIMGGVSTVAVAQSRQESSCRALFAQGAAQLASEDYERMLSTAQEHMKTCPGPKSALLLGLAEAHRVDAQLIADPPRRERARKRALYYLRVAATHGQALPSEWLLSIGEWIVSLQQRGPVATESDLGEVTLGEPVANPAAAKAVRGRPVGTLAGPGPVGVEVFEIPKAPAPRARPQFPWGPLVSMTLGGVGLTTAVVLAINANDRFAEVQAASEALRVHRDELSEEGLQQRLGVVRDRRSEARDYARWATISAVGGGAALLTGLAWYWLLPPEGKWRWAVTPMGVSASARF